MRLILEQRTVGGTLSILIYKVWITQRCTNLRGKAEETSEKHWIELMCLNKCFLCLWNRFSCSGLSRRDDTSKALLMPSVGTRVNALHCSLGWHGISELYVKYRAAWEFSGHRSIFSKNTLALGSAGLSEWNIPWDSVETGNIPFGKEKRTSTFCFQHFEPELLWPPRFTIRSEPSGKQNDCFQMKNYSGISYGTGFFDPFFSPFK